MSDRSPPTAAGPSLDKPASLPRRGLGQRLREAWDSDIAHSFRTSPVTILAAICSLTIIFAALFAPLIAPFDPFDAATLILDDAYTPPMTPNEFTGNVYWLGTDDQGRDVFSSLLYGARTSLLVGLAAVLFAATLGVVLGLLAGYYGGWLDGVIMRIADVQLTFPSILIALLIFGIARSFIPPAEREGLAIIVLVLSIGLSDWVQYARTVRSATLVERSREYVQAAKLLQVSNGAILLRHILPNVMGPVLVIGTIGLALAIIAEATLSFLGVGVPPTEPSLGTQINTGQEFIRSGEWWIMVFPAATLLLLSLSVNLLGDWMRDALNPKLG